MISLVGLTGPNNGQLDSLSTSVLHWEPSLPVQGVSVLGRERWSIY